MATLSTRILEKHVGKPFQFTVSGKDLEASIKKAIACLDKSASGTRCFSLNSDSKGVVTIIALSNDTWAAIKVDNVKDATTGIFSFDPAKMLGVIKGRDDLAFKITEHDCEFKAVKTKYAGKLFTIPLLAEVAAVVNANFKEAEADTSLSVDILSMLREGLTLVALKDPYSGSEMLINFKLTKEKEVKMASIDGYHIAVYTSPTVKFKGKPFEIVLSLPLFQLIEKTIGSAPADISIQPGNLKVATGNAILILPLNQSVEDKFNIAYSYYDMISPLDFTFETTMSQMVSVISNVSTLYSDNTYLDFLIKAGSDSMRIALKSNSGEASDSIKITFKKASKKDIRFVIDPRILQDCISVSAQQTDTKLQLKAGQTFLIKGSSKLGGTAIVACSLAESDGD